MAGTMAVLAAVVWTLYLCWHLYRRTSAETWPSVSRAGDALFWLALAPASDGSATDVVHSDEMRGALKLGWTLLIAHVAYGLVVLVTLGQGHAWFVVAIAPSGVVSTFVLPVWLVLVAWRLGTDAQPPAGGVSEVSE